MAKQLQSRTFSVENIYPKPSKALELTHFLHMTQNLFILIAYLCFLTNAILGGFVWSIIVLGALMVAWVAFLYRPMVENTLIKKFCDTLTAVCVFLFLLNDVLGTSWAMLVVPIVFWGNVLLICLLFMIFFGKQKRNCMPLLEMMTTGLALTLLMLVIDQTLAWPMIVLGAVCLGMLILLGTLYWKTLLFEFRKRWHV